MGNAVAVRRKNTAAVGRIVALIERYRKKAN